MIQKDGAFSAWFSGTGTLNITLVKQRIGLVKDQQDHKEEIIFKKINSVKDK